MANKLFGGLMVGFVAIIIGLALFVPIGDKADSITNAQSVTNESFTGVDNVSVDLDHNYFAAVSAVRNSTHDTLTVTTDYTVQDDDGSITVLTGNGTYYADYTYYADDYVYDASTRTLTNLILVFFALAIVAGAIWASDIKELFNL